MHGAKLNRHPLRSIFCVTKLGHPNFTDDQKENTYFPYLWGKKMKTLLELLSSEIGDFWTERDFNEIDKRFYKNGKRESCRNHICCELLLFISLLTKSIIHHLNSQSYP